MRSQAGDSQVVGACLALCAVLATIALRPASVWAAPTAHRVVAPLPASDYALRSTCAAPEPGHAACMAVELVPQSAEAKAHTRPLGRPRSIPLARATGEVCSPPSAAKGCYGLRPQDLHSAYDLPASAPSEQTIALVDAYDDPNIEADLKVYDEEFDLPACTSGNGCFRKVDQNGAASPLPSREGEWSVEIALDVEIAHAVCQSCRIVLVEAQSASYANLETAEQTAAEMGAQEISNSWAGGEPVIDSSAFEHPGVVITAAAGDNGYLNWDDPELSSSASYPASSPHVVAVGGTRLDLTAAGAWEGETVWNGGSSSERKAGGAGGSGCSARYPAPAWQLSLSDWSEVGCGSYRAVADVSADADPYTGVAVYDSTPLSNGKTPKWFTLGGTSLSSPLIAATFALAGGGGGVEDPARTLYTRALAEPGLLHDVTSGSNGACAQPVAGDGLAGCTSAEEAQSCSMRAICLAGAGYDGPTGLGTPEGIGAFTLEPRKSQQIAFLSNPPEPATVGGPSYMVSATASSGLAVSISSATPAVCTLSGSAVSFQAIGTCTLGARQAGDAEYAAAPEMQQSFAVGKGSQKIEFTTFPESARVGGEEAMVAAVASSGLPVSTQSATPTVCSLSGRRLTLLHAGTCTIEAEQPGDADWEAASSAQRSFTVQKGTQQIGFTSVIEAATVGQPTFTVTAVATSGLAVAFSSVTPTVCQLAGAQVSFVGGGTCQIEAEQSGDADWEAAPRVIESFFVRKRAQTLQFSSAAPLSATVGGSAYQASAEASSRLPASIVSMTPSICAVSGTTVSFIAAGPCTIEALQPGNAEYEAAPAAEQSFDVSAALQTGEPLQSGELLPAVSGEPQTPASQPSLLGGLGSQPVLAPVAATSFFTLVGAPRVDRRTGAIDFTAKPADPGMLSWHLSIEAPAGGATRAKPGRCPWHGCQAEKITFANGRIAAAAGTLRISVKPSHQASTVLFREAKAGRQVRVVALLSFQSSLGAGLFSRTRTIDIKLR